MGRTLPKAGSRRKSEDVAGPEVARTIQEIIKGAYQPRTGAIATLLGLATLVFGASSIFVELHDAMNTIWHVSLPPDRTNAATVIRLIRDRFYSFATVLGIGFLLLVSLVLNAWMAAMRIAVPRAATVCDSVSGNSGAVCGPLQDRSGRRIEVERRRPRSHDHLIAVCDWQAGHGAILRACQLRVTYSAAGSPIVVLLWVYYSAQLFFWGAEFSKVYKRTVSSKAA